MCEDEVIGFLVEGNMVSDNHPSEFYPSSVSSYSLTGMSSFRRCVLDPTLGIEVVHCSIGEVRDVY